MKSFLSLCFLCFLALVFDNLLAAADNTPGATLCPWPDDKLAALAFTFDDGHPDHANLIAPVFAAHGLRATFFLNPGAMTTSGSTKVGSWDTWRTVARAGHEIGNHGWSHRSLTGLSPTDLEREVRASQLRLSEELAVPVTTFAYPFCKEDAPSRQLVMTTHHAGRGYHPLYQGPIELAQLQAWVHTATAARGAHIFLSHGIDSKRLDDHLTWLKAQPDLWITTYAQLTAYALARRLTTLVVEESSPSQVAIRLEQPQSATISRQTLSVRFSLPSATSQAICLDTGVILRRTSDAVIATLPDTTSVIRITWR